MLKPLLTIALLSACSTAQATPQAVAPVPAPTVATANGDAVIELASRRAQMIGWLREYREAGEYPTDAAGRVASVFVGVNGVRCPMAELLHRSGRDDLVAAVARDNNTIRLADVREGPLFDWMLSSGLTLDEINLVQGIANIDYGWMKRELPIQELGPNDVIFAGKAQVRGKLETAEVALRDGTGTSLVRAAKRLPARRTIDGLAHAPIVKGAVVPKPTQAELRAQAQAQLETEQQARLEFQRTYGSGIRIRGMN